MRRRLANVVSAILHPTVLPVIAFWALLFIAEENLPNRNQYLAIAFTVCTLSPIVVVLVLIRAGIVNDYDVSDRKRRLLPFILGVIVYIAGYFVMQANGAPVIVSGLILCYAINTFIIMFITLQWKISVHMASLGGPIAALTFVFGPAMLLLLLLVPLLAWSRVVLKAHTRMQTLAGAALGFFFTYIELKVFFGA
ncbi:MAG: hypothetical protein IAF08_16730 [Rhizobacter sp.]|nr:hypothetical protein [Chlorobiales bacterium]